MGDLTYAAAMSRLDELLSFFGGLQSEADLMETLDTLYIPEVPDRFLPIIKRILGHLSHTSGKNQPPNTFSAIFFASLKVH